MTKLRTMTRALILSAALFAGPALAEMVGKSVNFTVILTDEGEPMLDPVACANKATPCDAKLTLGSIAFYALRVPEQNLSWDENLRRAELAAAVRNAKDYALLTSDADLIKKQVARSFGPAVVLAVARALGQADEAAKQPAPAKK